MKISLAFLGGALLISGAVVLSGRLYGGIFLAGIFAGAVLTWALAAIVGLERVGRWLVAFDAASRGTECLSAATPGRRDKKPRRVKLEVIPSPKVLRPVQQDVVSALVNLKMPMAKAQELVLEAYKPGVSFEELFKACLPQKRAANA